MPQQGMKPLLAIVPHKHTCNHLVKIFLSPHPYPFILKTETIRLLILERDAFLTLRNPFVVVGCWFNYVSSSAPVSSSKARRGHVLIIFESRLCTLQPELLGYFGLEIRGGKKKINCKEEREEEKGGKKYPRPALLL